jgi:hypothetical protein
MTAKRRREQFTALMPTAAAIRGWTFIFVYVLGRIARVPRVRQLTVVCPK